MENNEIRVSNGFNLSYYRQNPNHIQTGSGPEYVSRLFVIGLANGAPRFCGIAKTNPEALELADKATACSRSLPDRKLK